MGTPSLSNLPFSRSTFFQVRGRPSAWALKSRTALKGAGVCRGRRTSGPRFIRAGNVFLIRGRTGPVYVATSVGAGRLLLADSTRGEPPFCGPPRWVQETGKGQPGHGAGERAVAQQAQKRTARLGGPSSMQGRLIGRYKRPATSLPGRRGFPGRRGWSGSQRSGGRRTCTPAHRQCPRPKSAPRPYRRPFGPFPAG